MTVEHKVLVARMERDFAWNGFFGGRGWRGAEGTRTGFGTLSGQTKQ